MNGRKWMLNNPKLDVNACAKFCQNPFIHTQDIERNQNSDVIQGTYLCTSFLRSQDIERKLISDVIQGP